jgi:hypothetical protein
MTTTDETGPAAKRPGPAQPPVPQPSAPKPPPKPPVRPTATLEPEAAPSAPAYEDDPPPPPPAPPAPVLDERLRGVGQRLQLLVEAAGEHLGEARAIAGVLRPDGAAYGRMEGLLQAIEYDREALVRAIEHLRVAAEAIARERQAETGATTS